jgi:hypothetical protein
MAKKLIELYEETESEGVISTNKKRTDVWNLRHRYYDEVFSKYSELVAFFAENFYVGGTNYSYISNFFFLASSSLFSNAGLFRILSYISYCDENINEGDELVETCINSIFPGVFLECARIVCRKKRVKLKVLKESYKKPSPFYNSDFFLKSLLWLRVWVRYLFGLMRRILGKTDLSNSDVLLLSNLRFASHDENKNQMFGNVKRALEGRNVKCKVLRYEVVDKLSEIRRFLTQFVFEKVAYIGDYYRISHFLKMRKEVMEIRQRWANIRNSNKLKRKCHYRGYDFFKLMQPRFDLTFNRLSIISADTKLITKAIIEKEDFKVLVLDHEENLYGKGFMLNNRVGKSKSVVALSHELIHKSGTIHTFAQNKRVLDRNSKIWRPLPDTKCVWGEYGKKILINKCNYPAEIIRITGNPKFDSLINSDFNQAQIKARFKLSHKKKLLFASENRQSFYPFVLEIAKRNPNIEVIFKPHPLEDEKAISQVFSNPPKNFILTPGHLDIYPLISVSDYVATVSSSAGFEALVMGKVLFILNIKEGLIKGLPYLQSGAAVEIKCLDDISKWLHKLKDKECQKMLKRKSDSFVTFINGKSERKASIRVAEIIQENLHY